MNKRMDKVNGGWRIATIILGLILLILTCITAYGFQIVAAEETCSTYCYDSGYESFYYDYGTKICDCYVGADVVEKVVI